MGADCGRARFARWFERASRGWLVACSLSTCGFSRQRRSLLPRWSPQIEQNRRSRPIWGRCFAKPRRTARCAQRGTVTGAAPPGTRARVALDPCPWLAPVPPSGRALGSCSRCPRPASSRHTTRAARPPAPALSRRTTPVRGCPCGGRGLPPTHPTRSRRAARAPRRARPRRAGLRAGRAVPVEPRAAQSARA